MRHFVMCQVESVEFSQKVCTQTAELFLIGHCDTPANREHVLDFLQFQHKTENFIVVAHDLSCENSRQRCQICHFVVK